MDGKTAYIEKLSAQMVEWDAQIDLLKFKADAASAGLTHEYLQKVDALQRKRHYAEEKLQGISAASEDTWKDLQAGTDDVWDEVRNDLHEAVVNIK